MVIVFGSWESEGEKKKERLLSFSLAVQYFEMSEQRMNSGFWILDFLPQTTQKLSMYDLLAVSRENEGNFSLFQVGEVIGRFEKKGFYLKGNILFY